MSNFDITNHIPQAIAALRAGAALAIREACKTVSSDAANWAPIDTGFLKASNYYVTSDLSTYNQAVGKAQGVDPFRAVLDEVEHPKDDQEGIVAVAASYAAYVEFGTSRAGAQPFLHPAVEAMRGKLPGILEKAMKKAIASAAIGGES